MKSLSCTSVFFILIFLTLSLIAAPHAGERYTFLQPDSTFVPVHVWGDELYQRVESPSGFPLLRDATGWICFAFMGPNNELLPSHERYTLSNPTPSFVAPPQARSMVATPLQLQRTRTERSARALTPLTVTDTIVGLTILIDFFDQPSTIPLEEIDNFLNQPGYSGYGCNGSVHDYFFDVSGGKLTYKNQVFAYYRAANSKSYYDGNTTSQARTKELIKEALIELGITHFDEMNSALSRRDGKVISLNVLYAGSPTYGWGFGLWPHQSTLGNYDLYATGALIFDSYQITNIGTDLQLDVFCHENGHMVCGWPDLYDRMIDGSSSSGVGNYCLMGFKGVDSDNPSPPNGYLRYLAGWDSAIVLDTVAEGSLVSLPVNSAVGAVYARDNGTELFWIEGRKKGSGTRNASLPSEGLMIWHIDRNQTSNDFEQMTPVNHYQISLEQADGRFDLERSTIPGGDSTDLFSPLTATIFTDSSTPSAKWWDGTPSLLKLKQISAPATTISFVFGDGVTPVATKGNSIMQDFSMAVQKDKLQITLPLNGAYQWEIFTLSGRLVYSNQVHGTQGKNSYKLPLLPQGTYITRVVGPAGELSAKMVLNR